MPTGKEDLLQALVEAFIMEKGTQEFYQQAATKSASHEARKTFDDLAKWEQQHMAYIQSLYQSILDDRELEEFASFSKKVNAPITESGIPVKDLEKQHLESHPIQNEKDALALALTMEAKAYNLYRDLSRRAERTETKVIFEDMMNQETKHLDHLTKLKQNLPA